MKIVDIISVLCIFIIIIDIIFIIHKGYKKLNRNTLPFFIPLYIVGIAQFIIGLEYLDVYPFHINVVYSIFYAFRIFTVSIDDNLFALADANILYYISLVLSHMVASFSILIVLITTLDKNLKNKFNLARNRKKDNVIIFGDSDNAFEFVKNNQNSTIIWINNEKKVSRKNVSYLNLNLNEKIIKIDKKSKKEINIKFYKTLLKTGFFDLNHSSKIISLFDEDEKNLDIGLEILDIYQKFNKALRTKDFKVHIQYGDIKKASYFKLGELSNNKIRFFNYKDLLARFFIQKFPFTKYLLDTNLINTKNASYKQKISHFFIGFGQTNKNILINSIVNFQTNSNFFRAYCFDSKKDCESCFKKEFYGLFFDKKDYKDKTKYYPTPNRKFKIKFEELDIESLKFKNNFLKYCGKYNFICISLGNDKLNIESAFVLDQLLITNNIENFKIFVNIAEPNKYNINQIKTKNMIIFGDKKKIMCSELLFDDHLDKIAKRIAFFYDKYDQFGNDLVPELQFNNENINSSWDKLDYTSKQSNRAVAMSLRIKLNLMGLDLANFNKFDKYNYKIINEQEYMKIYDTKNHIPYLKGKEFYKYYNEPTLRNNLAYIEHERWNLYMMANQYLMLEKNKLSYKKDDTGKYKFLGRHDRSRLRHICLTTINGLDQIQKDAANQLIKLGCNENEAMIIGDTRLYDYFVLDNIFDILKDTDFVIIKKIKKGENDE